MAHITWNSGAGFVPAVLCGLLAARSVEQFALNATAHKGHHWYECRTAIADLAGTIIYGVLAAFYAAATWESAYWISAAAITPYALGAVVVLSIARALAPHANVYHQKQIRQYTFAGLMIAIPTLYILSEM